ncbi:MAG: fumarylacetoacetate hydrolase [Streptosporangiales bacterium]|nr:fumarylacetoacetate hydrolase [Streptosporangiales bacterium]
MTAADVLPGDGSDATLVARVYDPAAGGPCVAAVRGDRVADLTPVAPTVADLIERDDPTAIVRGCRTDRTWPLADLLAAAPGGDRPHLLAPCDLQVIKACGVTFARSLLERLIEERAEGDPARAEAVRARVQDVVGAAVGDLEPGSAEAERVKDLLVAEGLWSQYLEVGIGPDAEVFTKTPVLAAVGPGAHIGILRQSSWNNPEPEVALAVDSQGRAVGATLANDVNLRDVEGRSALLLPRAKDNNASCAVGPFIRLFDGGFGMDDVRNLEITLTVTGADGYVLEGHSSMAEISRDPEELIGHAMGRHHQYPDGMILLTGTLFAPTEDRDVPGEGFTHKPGDLVRITSPRLGGLVNVVTYSEDAPPWTYGIRDLMSNLATRGLLR